MEQNFDQLLIEKYYNFKNKKNACDIVHDYLVEKQLIITGGLVIDFSLRLFGQKLYEDFELPDYDFFSNDPANTASDIFELLYENQFKEISIIPGAHINTIRVRVNKDPIADITYLPKKILKQYKKSCLRYKDLIFRNPFMQFCDFHRALSYPFENPPREVINFRWIKDFKRYCLLSEYYTIDQDPDGTFTIDKDKVGNLFTQSKIKKYNFQVFHDNLTFKKKANIKNVIMGDFAILVYLSILDYNYIFECELDDENVFYKGFEEKVSYLVNDYETYINENLKEFKNSSKYVQFLEYIPKRIEGNKEIIYCSSNKTGIIKYMEFIVPCINFIINYCYFQWFITKNYLYAWLFLHLNQKLAESFNQNKADKVLFPSIITYGEEGQSEIIKYIDSHPDEQLRVPPIYINPNDDEESIKNVLQNLPRDFKYKPEIYQMDGIREY